MQRCKKIKPRKGHSENVPWTVTHSIREGTCAVPQRDPTKNNDDRNFKKSHYCPFNMKTFTIQKIRTFLRINI